MVEVKGRTIVYIAPEIRLLDAPRVPSHGIRMMILPVNGLHALINQNSCRRLDYARYESSCAEPIYEDLMTSDYRSLRRVPFARKSSQILRSSML